MRCAFATHDVNRAIAGPQIGPKQAICAVRCASQKIIVAMRCVFAAICALAAEIHCDAGHESDASIIVSGEVPGEKRAHKHKMFALVNVQMALGQTAGCPRVSGPKSLCISLETQEI